MDIETDRTPQNMVEPGHNSSRADRSGDSTPGGPAFENRNRMICMPSSRAIADAIIRRALAQVRG
jgi:hypothetical protein